MMATSMSVSGTIGWFVLKSGLAAADVVFWRCLFGAIALALACWRLGFLSYRLSTRQVILALAGGLAIVSNWLLLFGAFSRSTIAVSTAVYNLQPFILLGLGALFLGERVTAAKLSWIGLSFAGVLLLSGLGTQDLDTTYLTGVAMALGAAFAWAVSAILTKRLAGVPPHLVALLHVCVGVVAIAPLADWSHPPSGLETWSSLATIGIVHTGLVYILMYEAIQRLPTHIQGGLSFIYPVVAILVDVLALGHRLVLSQIIGIGAILMAAAAVAGVRFGRSRPSPLP